ncbi:MAG: rRNA maturation RNase YbeY [Acidobacteria bacterium]|nr:rRNA maturation RNase YbeY [Acidobacteriota bacterium]
MRGPAEQSVGELLRNLRDQLAPTAQGVSITYVDNRGMRKLNREHRGINAPTDILSFPSHAGKGEFPHLGDLVICLPYAEKMAKKFGVSRRREVETLLIHGFLHLCGYDHEKDQGEMLALQAQLERHLLAAEPLPMALKRGRKAGSRLKVLKDGRRVVVTGRAAQAIERGRKVRKPSPPKVKASVPVKGLKRKAAAVASKPGRPRKAPAAASTPAVRKPSRRRGSTKPSRSGVIA